MKNILFLLLSLPGVSFSQIIIPTGSVLNANANTNVVMLTPYNIVNNSSFDFSTTKLDVILNGAIQNITGNLFVTDFLLDGEGAKTINGNITVTNKFQFDKGILAPSPTSKLLFTGPEDGISGGNNSSYCNGVFYSAGSGKRVFPLGTDGTFAYAKFESIEAEVGVTIMNGNASLLFDTASISSVYETRYWEIKTDPAKINSRVALSLNGLDAFLKSAGGTTVMQADNVGGSAKNLGSSTADETIIISQSNVTSSILTLGKEKSVTIRIHDLITPSGSEGKNDKLTIENIGKYDHNKVTLLDRWGARVNEWVNFTNEVNYDFNKLSAGNYICIVEYGNTGKANQVKQQMVTILKTN